jgi:hypothetical protein
VRHLELLAITALSNLRTNPTRSRVLPSIAPSSTPKQSREIGSSSQVRGEALDISLSNMPLQGVSVLSLLIQAKIRKNWFSASMPRLG